MLGGPPMWVQNLGGAEDRDKLVLQIIRLIQSATEPAAWDVNGGEGAISEFNGTLIVKADAQMHRRIADLIPTLHQALVEQAARSMRNEHVMRLMVEIDELRFAGKYESALEVVRQAMLIDPGHPMVQAARRVLEETIERKAGQ
jgi:hypothetical protein